jgi:hypothetical protein
MAGRLSERRRRLTDAATWAGFRLARFARSTGTLVVLVNGEEAGLDTDGGPWSMFCADHGCVIGVDTRQIAESLMSHPEGWCDVDGGCVEAGRGES